MPGKLVFIEGKYNREMVGFHHLNRVYSNGSSWTIATFAEAMVPKDRALEFLESIALSAGLPLEVDPEFYQKPHRRV